MICVRCGHGLERLQGGAFACGSCGAAYPEKNGVPLLLNPEKVGDRVAQLKAGLGMHYVPDDALSEVLSSSVQYFYSRPGLEQEFANILGRFPGIVDAPSSNTGAGGAAAGVPAVTDMLLPQFRPGERTSRSLRFKNESSDITLATEGATPHHLSYHLYDDGGALLSDNGPRSRIPIPLEPGRELTIPLRIVAPDQPGRYRLEVRFVQELVRWHEPSALIEIEVQEGVRQNPLTEGLQGDFDYETDFNTSVGVIRSALSDTSQPRVLEVACGLYPVSAGLVSEGVELTAVDLCWPELQMASLIYNRPDEKRTIDFVCADVDELPFESHGFDAVVICAALHHFPNPTETLATLRKQLRPGGRAILLREPCHVNVADVGYLADLKRGFNEQQFRVDEYVAMVEGAGYSVKSGQIDFGGSLKLVAVAA